MQGFKSDVYMFQKRTKDFEDKIRRKNTSTSIEHEKHDILNDVNKLKQEINNFQHNINEGREGEYEDA